MKKKFMLLNLIKKGVAHFPFAILAYVHDKVKRVDSYSLFATLTHVQGAP